ncbi:RNA polymerase sigma factor [Nonomuraea sp. PA05]|uniref:RNA polymerase sigma factor n=1 Tax=Nonomuraea sp. PA05 TaxID=2604466 RepID=UPI0011DB2D5A|nr:RNA polymerase sigma factor [Nonomuraea sp. PA05]TYB56398.1 RNA polymerase sigma factor [Nonomuraea sp. PA05]
MAESGGWPGERLIAGAQRGDVESISALVSGSHPHVRRFARTLCASPEDAEDAAQEALIILYRKIGTLRATGALASWMFRIVRNECLRRARLALRQPQPAAETRTSPAGEARVSAEGARAVSAEEEVIRRLEADRVAAAVAALPADQRNVLIMRDIQGLSGRTTAGLLGLSVPAMKSRLHRARAAVQRSLESAAWGGDGDD